MPVLLEDEKIEPLGNNMEIVVSASHTFGTDAILLANFVSIRRKDVACDMGTGCGIIPLLWCRHKKPKSLTAVDIQSDATELLKMSAEHNLIEGIQILNADLRALPKEMQGKYTLVTMNPPYKKVEGGLISPNMSRAIARHEIKCTVSDMTKAAAGLLKPSGRLCVCHRPERLTDLICAMREAGIEPKRLQLVCQRVGDSPMLILCEGRRGGNSGMTVEPPLIVENAEGGYSPKMKEIYTFMEEL